MPRALKSASTAEPTAQQSRAPSERKRTPVRPKPAALTVPEFNAGAHYEEIAHLAYLNWLQRGAEVGNPEQDWFEAEQSIRAKYLA